MAWNKHLVSIKLMLKVVIDADDADLIIALVVGNKMNAIMWIITADYHKVDTERAGTEDVNVV